MTRATRKDAPIVVGGTPRIDLLPPEVHDRQKGRALRRRLMFVIALVAVVMAGAVAYSVFLATSAQSQLALEHARSQSLLAQQLEFQEVTTLSREADSIVDARAIGASTEILWQEYMQAVQATVPEGASITVLSVVSSSPISGVAQSTAPLQAPRVATLALSLVASDLPTIAQWIANLPGLTGYADATLNTIEPSDAGILANVTLNIGVDAFANRYAEEG